MSCEAEKVYGHWEWGRYPVQQCYQRNEYKKETPIHMLDRVDQYEVRVYRCDSIRDDDEGYDWADGSYTMTTKDTPTCPYCLQWLEGYLKQEVIPFPNGYDVNGFWVYLPEVGKPIPKWLEKVKNLSEELRSVFVDGR